MLPDCHLAPAAPSLAFFTFAPEDVPFERLRFGFDPSPRQLDHVQIQKRCRATNDVDCEGAGCFQKKKRRLRFDLITSRLSQPYATPTTYIAGHGNSRIGKWARRQPAGPSMLRKAAIINSARLRRSRRSGTTPGRKSRPRSVERTIQDAGDPQDSNRSVGASTVSPDRRIQHTPSIPSPLGVSNYDALNREGDPYDDGGLYDTDDDLINSDFKEREHMEMQTSWLELPPFPLSIANTMPEMPSSKYVMSLIDDEEMQKEVSFAQFDSVSACHDVSFVSPFLF